MLFIISSFPLAQYFGTAQRRRRIFLVADFGGERAGEVLFVPKSLQGYFAAGGTPRQGSAAYAAGGTDGAGGNIAFACNQRDEVRDLRDLSAALCAQPGMKQQTFIADGSIAILNDQGGDRINVEQSGCSPTLRSETHGHPPVVAREAYPINTQLATRHVALGKNTGFGVGGDGDPAFTLQESHSHAVAICETSGESAAANCLTSWDTQQSRIFTEDGVSPTLAGADGGGGRNPGGLIYTAGFCAGAGAKARGVGYEDECAPTLKGGGGGFQMPTVVCAAFMGDSSPSSYGVEYMEEGAPTLKPRLSGTPCLCAATGQTGAEVLENRSPTLTCHHEQPILYKAVGVHQNQNGDVNTADTAYSLATTGNATSRNAPLVAHPKVSGTLCASGAGLSRPAGMASETDLCVVQQSPGVEPIPIHDKATRYSGGGDTRKNDGAGNGLGVGKSGDPAPTITAGDRHAVAAYCLQGNMIGRKDKNGPRGNGVNEDVSFTLNATDSHAVAAVDCRNMRERPELSGTLQAKENGSYSLNYQNPIRMGYIVRRLTPTECERLQGYPDGWTACGYDGKPISDTRRYMMLGNSIAVPCVAYIMMGIAEAHKKAFQTKERGDSSFH